MIMKKGILLVCVFVLLLVTACGNPDYISDFENGTQKNSNALILDEDTADRYTFLKEGCNRLATNYKGIFYIAGGDSVIKYYDYSSGKMSVWCNNVACKHEDSSCAAFVESENPYVEWYNGYVYKIVEENKGLFLMRYKEDGTEEVRIANLLGEYPSGADINIGRIYNGEMYFFAKKNAKDIDVCKVDLLKKDSVESIFCIDQTDSKISATGMYINDKCIYISLAQYKKNSEEKNVYKRLIYQYDFKSNEIKSIAEDYDVVRSCANDNLYFTTSDNKLFKLEDDGRITEVHAGVFEALPYNDYNIFCNESYMVFARGSSAALTGQDVNIYVYDFEKDTLKCIEEEKVHETFGEQDTETEKDSVENDTDNVDKLNMSKEFTFFYGLAGEYAYVSSTKSLYVIKLDTGEVQKLNVEFAKEEKFNK